MIIGNFRYDPSADIYTGSIRTLAFRHEHVVLKPLARNNDREPDYRVLDIGEAGAVEFGAAWRRRSDRGHDYLSVLLDAPGFAQPISVAMFLDGREDSASLVWTRPQRRAAPEAEPTEPAPAATSRKSGLRKPAHG